MPRSPCSWGVLRADRAANDFVHARQDQVSATNLSVMRSLSPIARYLSRSASTNSPAVSDIARVCAVFGQRFAARCSGTVAISAFSVPVVLRAPVDSKGCSLRSASMRGRSCSRLWRCATRFVTLEGVRPGPSTPDAAPRRRAAARGGGSYGRTFAGSSFPDDRSAGTRNALCFSR